jgi:hypothetical protein
MVPFPKIAFSDMKIKIFRISKKRSHISSFALCLGRNLPIPFIKLSSLQGLSRIPDTSPSADLPGIMKKVDRTGPTAYKMKLSFSDDRIFASVIEKANFFILRGG